MWMSTTALRGTPRTTTLKKVTLTRPAPAPAPAPPCQRVDVPAVMDEPENDNDDASWSTTTSSSNQDKDGGETKYDTVESSYTSETGPSASWKDASSHSHNVPADQNQDSSPGIHRSYGVRLRRSRSGIGRPTAAAAAARPTTTNHHHLVDAANSIVMATPSRVRTRIRPRRFVRMDRPPVRPRTTHVLVSTIPTEEDRQEQSAASTVRMKDIWSSRGIGIPKNTNLPTSAPSAHSSHSSHGHSRKHSQHGHTASSKSVTHTATTSPQDGNRKKESDANYSDTKWRSLLEQERANNALLQSRIDGLTQLANLYQAQLLASHASQANTNSSNNSLPQDDEQQQQCPVHHPSNNLKCTCTSTDHEVNTNNTHPDNIFI